MTAVWPDCSAATTPRTSVRDQLDYLVWIAEAIEPVGFHATDEVERWRGRVDRAYQALVDSMVPGHGDPLPPDVPPSVRPGTWPDVPAATIPGMTVRHQLTVIRTVASASRTNPGFPRQPSDLAGWVSRVQTAHDALDHGPALAMPPEARSVPPPPPPPRKRKKGHAPAPAPKGKAGSARQPRRPSAPASKKAASSGSKKSASRPPARAKKAARAHAKDPKRRASRKGR